MREPWVTTLGVGLKGGPFSNCFDQRRMLLKDAGGQLDQALTSGRIDDFG